MEGHRLMKKDKERWKKTRIQEGSRRGSDQTEPRQIHSIRTKTKTTPQKTRRTKSLPVTKKNPKDERRRPSQPRPSEPTRKPEAEEREYIRLQVPAYRERSPQPTVRRIHAMDIDSEETDRQFWMRIEDDGAKPKDRISYKSVTSIMANNHILKMFQALRDSYAGNANIIIRFDKCAKAFLEAGIDTECFVEFFAQHCLTQHEKNRIDVALQQIDTIQ